MPSKLQMVNRVLAELGQQPVQSLTQTEASSYVSAKLDELKPELLLDANWWWAIVYIDDNAPLAVNFSPDYEYTFQMPGNFGRFYRWATTSSQWPIYEFIDGYLLAQVRPVQYYYIINDADWTVLPPLFARALVLYAAAKSAPTLTNNVQLTAYLNKEFELMKARAIVENDTHRSISSVPYNSFNRITYV